MKLCLGFFMVVLASLCADAEAPLALAAFPSGRLIVVGSAGSLFTLDTAKSTSTLAPLTRQLKFERYLHIAAATYQGAEFLVVAKDGSIEVYGVGGEAASAFATQLIPFAGPAGGLAVDSTAATIYLSDAKKGEIWRMGLAGGSAARVASTKVFEQLGALALGRGGKSLFVTDPIRGRVYEVALTGDTQIPFSTVADNPNSLRVLADPMGIAWHDKLGQVFVVDEHRDAVFRTSAQPSSLWITFKRKQIYQNLKLGDPVSVAVDSSDIVWVADRETGNVLAFDPQSSNSVKRRLGLPAPAK